MAPVAFPWFIVLAVFVLSSLPLYFPLKFLGAKAKLLAVIFVNLLVGLVTVVVKYLFDTWGGLFAFILMILIYKEMFEIGTLRAILAWLLQFVFAVILFIFIILILGVAIFI